MVVAVMIAKLESAAPVVAVTDVVIQITAAKTDKLIFKWFLTRAVIKS